MQQRTPASKLAVKSQSIAAGLPTARFNNEDKRQIFKAMVVSELEAGFLRYSNRAKLIEYASRIGIQEFEATLLIAEAQFYSEQIEPIHFEGAGALDTTTQPESWSASMQLTFALVTAMLVDLVLIYWLFV